MGLMDLVPTLLILVWFLASVIHRTEEKYTLFHFFPVISLPHILFDPHEKDRKNLLSYLYGSARLRRINGPKLLDATECNIGNTHLSKLKRSQSGLPYLNWPVLMYEHCNYYPHDCT